MTKKKPAASTKKKGKMTFIDLNNNDSAGENDNDRVRKEVKHSTHVRQGI
jgi:hypothetical protein